MFNREELKRLSKDQLKGKWTNGVLLTLIYMLIEGVISYFGNKSFGWVFTLFLSPPLSIGLIIAYIKFVKSGNNLEVSDLFLGFKNYLQSLCIVLWYSLWTFLWSLLFIVPGIIKGLAYSQSFYIIAENPNVKVRDALKLSIKMTEGFKAAIFIMTLSFIGWTLLGLLTLGIGFLWLAPYINTTYTNMYFKLKEISIQKGLLSEDEFNVVAVKA